MSMLLSIVLALSVIGVIPVTTKEEVQAATAEEWVLLPSDLVASSTLDKSISIQANYSAMYYAYDIKGNFTGLSVGGFYNGKSFYITSIMKYDTSDTKINSITIPENIKLCYKITIGSGKGESGEYPVSIDIGGMFSISTKAKLPSNDAKVTATVSSASVTGLGNANSVSSSSVIRNVEQNLTIDTLVLPSTISTLANGALSGNTRIKTIDMSNITTNDLTELGDKLFEGDTNLEKVILPKSVTEIGNETFKDCKNLKSFDFSKINTIGDSAFANCTSIENISLNSNSPLRSIGRNTFNGCTKLTELDFRNTNLNNIGSGAFKDCSYLRKIYFPDVEVTMTKDSFSLGSVDYIYIASRNDKYKNESGFRDYVDKLVNSDDILSGPVVIKQGTNTTKGNNIQSITNTSTLYIASGVDVDLDSVRISRDGTDITNSAELGLKSVNAKVNNRNVKVAAFTVPMYSYGNYTVVSSDVLGNSSTRQFAYLTTQSDKEAPTVNVNGVPYKDGTVKRLVGDSALLTVSDDNSLSSVYVNDTNILGQESNFALNGAGTYKIVARDMNNNTTTITITLIGKDIYPPVIKGIQDKSYYNKPVTFTYEDDSSCKVKGGTSIQQTGNKVIVSKDGTYKITITDEYGNETSVEFTIDTTKPEIKVQNGELFSKAVKIVAKDKNLKSITLNGKEITSGYTVSDSGSYTVVATDMADNKETVSFKIDTVAPVIKGVVANKIYKSVKVDVSDNSEIASIKVDDTETKNGAVIKKSGKHTLTVEDKAGNFTKIVFIIDTKKPVIKIKKRDLRVKKTFKVSDTCGIKTVKVGKKTYKGNGKKTMTIKFTKKGKIKIVVTDMAGNKTTKTVKVRKK